MQPKTLFDADSAKTVLAILTERHRRKMKPDEHFRLAARIEPPHVVVTLTLANADESLYYPMEARLPIENEGQDDEASVAVLCLDFLDYYVGEYLRGDRDVYLTLDWSGVRFGEVELQARGQVLNLKLERMADELLATADAMDGEQ